MTPLGGAQLLMYIKACFICRTHAERVSEVALSVIKVGRPYLLNQFMILRKNVNLGPSTWLGLKTRQVGNFNIRL